jgi:hypothetical protein
MLCETITGQNEQCEVIKFLTAENRKCCTIWGHALEVSFLLCWHAADFHLIWQCEASHECTTACRDALSLITHHSALTSLRLPAEVRCLIMHRSALTSLHLPLLPESEEMSERTSLLVRWWSQYSGEGTTASTSHVVLTWCTHRTSWRLGSVCGPQMWLCWQ